METEIAVGDWGVGGCVGVRGYIIIHVYVYTAPALSLLEDKAITLSNSGGAGVCATVLPW